jgi:hypothetical protein
VKVVLVWLLVAFNPHIANGIYDQQVFAAYTTKSACETAAAAYEEKEWRDEKLGRYGPKTPAWFPTSYSCTDKEIDPK